MKIITLVLKFAKNLGKKGEPLQDLKEVSKFILFKENQLEEAGNYFFKKTKQDVGKFSKPSQCEKISTESNGTLYTVT